MREGYVYGRVMVYAHWKTCWPLTERQEREDRLRMRVALAAQRMREGGIPAESVNLDEYPQRFQVDEANGAALTVCRNFVAAWQGGRRPKGGLTLCGAYGCGKTTLALAVGRTLCEAGVSVRLENVPALLNELRAAVKGGGLDRRLEQLQMIPVLILDDLGREQPSPWSVDQVLYPVVDRRYVEGRPILVTTNYRKPGLEARYQAAGNERGEEACSSVAVIERLRERSPWVTVGGGSRRSAEFTF